MNKRTIFATAFLAVLSTLFTVSAQTTTMPAKETRRIEVTGFSEMEITPDELYFTVSLREYFQDEKSQKDKVIISTLEKQLVKAVADAGLSKENLTVSGVGGYQQHWDKNKKPATFLESKQYQLKVGDISKLDLILSKVDSRGIQYANMSRVDHSRKEEFKKEVKIKALKEAREKATYLVEALGQKLGPVLEIREVEDNMNYPVPMYKSNMRMMAAESADAVQESDLEYQKIKISYRMQAAFEIR